MAYLLAVSFLLHIITFFLIVVLVQKINIKKTETEVVEQEKLKREIEDLLIAYTAEMKEENEKLLTKLASKRKSQEQVQSNTIKTYENLNSQTETVEMKKRVLPQPKPAIIRNVEIDDTYAPPIVEDTEDRLEQSSTAQILSLSKQGYSVKEIAKKLNIGDGEVELLLKFHR